MSHRVFVLMGSNHEPEKNLPAALALLSGSCDVLAASPVYESSPAGPGVPADAAPYLNAALLLATTLAPVTFKREVLLPIEEKLGRQRGADAAGNPFPVTIDLDICLWDEYVLEYGSKPWRIPHPDVLAYAHVARPLADLAPDDVHPLNGRLLVEIADALSTGDLRLRDDVSLAP